MAYLISLILLLLPTYLLRFSIAGVPTTVLEVIIYFVFLYGLWRAKKEGFRPIPLKILIPVGLLIIALISSTIIAPDRRTALGELKGFFIDPFLVFWLIFQFVKIKDIGKLIWALILSGLFVAVHTIIQEVLGHTAPDGRVIGIFGYSPNYVALYLAPITVLLIASKFVYSSREALAESRSSRQARTIINNYKNIFLTILFVTLNLSAIYFSGSRGGILAVGAGLGIFAIVYYWSWIRARLSSQIIIGIVILMAIYTGWTLFKPDFSASLASGRVVTSNNLRWQIWETSLELGSKHPLSGVGLGNFQNAFNELTHDRGNFPEYITPMALTPHNIFLMFWLSAGILGLAAFLWLLIIFYLQAFKKLFTSKLTIVLFSTMTTIVIYGLVESSIWKNDLSIIFWVIWGLVWVI